VETPHQCDQGGCLKPLIQSGEDLRHMEAGAPSCCDRGLGSLPVPLWLSSDPYFALGAGEQLGRHGHSPTH
jgi:hypothetical protein